MRLHKTWLPLAILAISVQTALADVDPIDTTFLADRNDALQWNTEKKREPL